MALRSGGAVRRVVEDLNARGLVLAETEATCDFIWIITAESVEVYDRRSKVLDAREERAALDGGRVIARAEIVRFVAFAGPTTSGAASKQSCVRLRTSRWLPTCRSRRRPTLDTAATTFLMETGWTATIGIAIANWAGTRSKTKFLAGSRRELGVAEARRVPERPLRSSFGAEE